ncbi:MAG: insulinase family protein [Proteobacteria bacterium]|nr:insulinase family protein [Pseudomonadota bacterium]MBU1716203.1 insulinase family protein [Pseudomonadota bacterium]
MCQKTVFENGVRIITEKIPSRTAAVGIWVDTGSRDENELNNGCAHFVEHMLFKGTKLRSAQQIAQELDVLGGMSNAFTSQENTCFYATVLDTHLSEISELLTDLFLDSVFDQVEVERERQVILQEISMVEDNPDELIHDIFPSLIFGKHPLGNTVLGSREVVSALDSAKLADYVSRYYTPDRIVITGAGNVDHQQFVNLWRDRFGAVHDNTGIGLLRQKPASQSGQRLVINKALEQAHILMGVSGLPIPSDDRYALLLLNIILGGNMSSRLFQEVREKKGLAYSVYSYISSYLDCGSVGIYLGVEPSSVNEALSLVMRELELLRTREMSSKELTNAKEYAKAGMFLSSENMESRMNRLARNEIYFNRFIPIEEVVVAIDAVTTSDLMMMAARLFGVTAMPIAALGPLTEEDIDWSLLR